MARQITYGPVLDIAGDDLKHALVGWRIVEVGITREYTSRQTSPQSAEDAQSSLFGLPESFTTTVEGGLTLILEKDEQRRKVILGYTELGEWLEYLGDCP